MRVFAVIPMTYLAVWILSKGSNNAYTCGDTIGIPGRMDTLKGK